MSGAVDIAAAPRRGPLSREGWANLVLLLALTQPIPWPTAVFEVVSATGTVGLSAGLSSGGLPDYLKMVLCADMLLGRLEIVAWLVIFYPKTWFGRRLELS